MLLLLIIFIATFSLRFIHLGADPPKTLSISSMGYMSDPGNYVSNARNKIVFGKWEIDNWNIMYVSPIPHWLTYFIFLLLGPGIAQMNLLPALFSCLNLVLVYLILKRSLPAGFVMIGTLILGTNYVFAMFSQIAVRVMPMEFFVLLSLFLLSRKQELDKLGIFLAGAMSFAAYTVKGTYLLIFPAFIIGLVCYAFVNYGKKVEKTLLVLFSFVSGLVSLAVIWFFVIYAPHKDAFLAYMHSNYGWLTPHSLIEVVKNFWFRPLFYFMNMPVVMVLASLSLLVFAYRFFTAPRNIPVFTWICSIWVMSNMVYYSLIYYRPARHYIPLIIPLVLLAAGFLFDLYKRKTIQKPERRPLLFFLFLYFWLLYIVSSVFILSSRPVHLPVMREKFAVLLVLSLLLTILIYVLVLIWPKKLVLTIPGGLKAGFIGILVLFSLLFNLKPFFSWVGNARYDRRNISQDLGKAFEHMRIGGLVAPVLALDNQHEAHPYSTGYINKGLDFIKRYQITHTLLTFYAEEKDNYVRDFPEFTNAALLARYPLWRSYVELYSLYPRIESNIPDVRNFEGELFFGENGLPRYDPDASGKLAFLKDKHGQGALLELPIGDFEPGSYRLVFRLKSQCALSRTERVARYDVVHAEKKKMLAYQELFASDFAQDPGYQDFELIFELKRSRPLTLRIFIERNVELWFDKAVITKKNLPDHRS